MANVLIINSSARKNSNSRLMAAKVAAGAERAGHSVKTIEVGKAKIHPCVGCGSCQDKTPGQCVFNDGMTGFYVDVKPADILLFASPIYYFNVSAQAKLFIDRMYALGKDGFGGKRIGGVFTYGGEDENDSGCVNAVAMFEGICAYAEAEWIGAVHGSAWEEGDVAKKPELLRKAEAFGAMLR